MKSFVFGIAVSIVGLSLFWHPVKTLSSTVESFQPDPALVEKGRYLAVVSGCNDCHTPQYPVSDGNTAEDQWFLGDRLGWSGPWGTTYASNLRIYMSQLSEAQWLTEARNMRRRPPMPWFNLNKMTDEDLKALYHFTRSLEPLGQPAPAALPPSMTPPTPYIEWVLGASKK